MDYRAPLPLTSDEWNDLAQVAEARHLGGLRAGDTGDVLGDMVFGVKFQSVIGGAARTFRETFVLMRDYSIPPLVITRGPRGRVRLERRHRIF